MFAWEHTISGACPTLKLVELVCLDLAKDKACNLEQGRCRTKRIEQTMKRLPLQRWRKNGCICNTYGTLWPILIVTWHLLYLLLQRGTFHRPCASHAPKSECVWPERETETWHVAGGQRGWLCSMMKLDWYWQCECLEHASNVCITFGLFDITQSMGNVRHLMGRLDWPHGLAMALHWLPLCDQVKEHKRRTHYLVWICLNHDSIGPLALSNMQLPWLNSFPAGPQRLRKHSPQTLSNHARMRAHNFRCLPYTEAGRTSLSRFGKGQGLQLGTRTVPAIAERNLPLAWSVSKSTKSSGGPHMWQELAIQRWRCFIHQFHLLNYNPGTSGSAL